MLLRWNSLKSRTCCNTELRYSCEGGRESKRGRERERGREGGRERVREGGRERGKRERGWEGEREKYAIRLQLSDHSDAATIPLF